MAVSCGFGGVSSIRFTVRKNAGFFFGSLGALGMLPLDTDEYVVNEEFVAVFGAIIQSFARFEFAMCLATAAILKVDLGAVMTIMAGLGYRGKLHAYQSILKLYRPDPAIAERLNWFNGEIGTHNTLRNNIAHSLWVKGTRPASIKPFQVQVHGGAGRLLGMADDEEDWTKPELECVVLHIDKRYTGLMSYLTKSGLLDNISEKIDESSSATEESAGKP